MKLVHARWLFDGEEVRENLAFAYDTVIEEVGPFEVLETRHPEAEVVHLGADEVAMPGLVNPHVHLEFGANTTQLRYGDFMTWLNSVIERRDELVEACRAGCYKRQVEAMLESGVTAFGAVSSYGKELAACRAAPQRVVYFNEAIGSQPAAVDALYSDFMQRLEASAQGASDRFVPAVAIHSPYSVHPVLMKKILSETRGMPLSAHFLESPAEAAWLNHGTGPFRGFFENFLKQTAPLQTPEAFLEALDRPALLVHAVQAEPSHFETMAKAGHSVAHCPRSNRLLGCGRLPLETVREAGVSWSLGTDGLSSNTSLNLWEEMRAALALHHAAPLEPFARELLRAATSRAAEALGLTTGRIAEGRPADFITLKLPGAVDSADALSLQAVLHTARAQTVTIQGKRHV